VRLRIDEITLVEGDRTVNFRPGLNVIDGPIATGKTTLLNLCRILLGSKVHDLIPELRALPAVNGRLTIGDRQYAVSRPLVSTQNAVVEVAEIGGAGEAWRLPVRQSTPGFEETYRDWLLRTLGLPRLNVPRAPSQPESDPTPVTIADYLNYCFLTQDEIDNSVMGHRDSYRNIKRRYVFEIVYGMYDIQTAALQDRLREATQSLRAITADEAALAQLLADTPWENKSELEAQLAQIQERQTANLASSESLVDEAAEASPLYSQFRQRISNLDTRISSLEVELNRERAAISDLEQLADELRAQSARLTRAIVAEATLVDFEFSICPRCGSPIQNRGDEEHCRLCLQIPDEPIHRDTLINEQSLISDQIVETDELIERSRETIRERERELQGLKRERADAAADLDAATESFVSDSASRISNLAGERSQLREEEKRLRDYLQLFDRAEQRRKRAGVLRSEIAELEEELAEARSLTSEVLGRFETLETRFEELLRRFNAPQFPTSERGGRIDRRTLLPVVGGRRFDELSSQGLKVLVNVAFALAHQLTAIELDLPLPNLLLIDGLTSNLGHEGEDRDRVLGMYSVLSEISHESGDTLQIVVADNDVPPEGQTYETLTLGPGNLLVRTD
jgi:predicted  nucleic acid-binding Zn-ribbon protein